MVRLAYHEQVLGYGSNVDRVSKGLMGIGMEMEAPVVSGVTVQMRILGSERGV